MRRTLRRHSCADLPASLGETRRPATVEELRTRPPRLGDSKAPPVLERLRTQSVLYVESDRAEEPRIEVVKSEPLRAGRSTWRVSVADPGTARITRTQHLRTFTRMSIGSVDVGKIDTGAMASRRPSWIDLSFTPRIAPAESRRTLRRMNGSPVRPTYVFGASDDRDFFFDASWPYGLVGNSDWNGQPWWVLAGYPVDVADGEVPSIQWPFSSFDPDGDSYGGLEIETTEADISGGNSGGPMFGWFGDGDPRIAGERRFHDPFFFSGDLV